MFLTDTGAVLLAAPFTAEARIAGRRRRGINYTQRTVVVIDA